MIFHKHKAIYFHIAKTAGTAVEKLLVPEARDAYVMDLEQFFGFDRKNNMFLQHATAQFMYERIDKAIFEDYFKFTIVRNPFVRCLSVYHYTYDANLKRFGSFESFIQELPRLVSDQAAHKGSHHSSQTMHTHIDGVQVCDHICHFEALPTSFNPIRKKLGIVAPLAKHNTRRWFPWGDKPVEEFYTPETIEIVQEVYADDFKNFSYSNTLDNLLPIKDGQ